MSKQIVTTPAAKSVVYNQNFEFNGLAFGYENYIGVSIGAQATSTAQSHSPTRSLFVDFFGSSYSQSLSGYVDTPSGSWAPNTTYYGSVWVWSPTFSTILQPSISLVVGSVSGISSFDNTIINLSGTSQGTWLQMKTRFVTSAQPIGDLHIQYDIGDRTNGMRFYLDDLLVSSNDSIDRVYNPIWFRSTSNLFGVDGHRYIFQVYDKNNTLLNTSRVIGNPQGVGEFDAGLILKDYLSYDLNYTSTDFVPALNSLKEYYIKMAESVNGGLVTSVGSQSTGIRLFFNQSFSYSTTLPSSQVIGLSLPGLNLSTSGPFYVRNVATSSNNVTSFQLFTGATSGVAVTATGTFNPDGYVQVAGNLIPRQTSSFITTNRYLCLNSSEHPVPQLLWNSGDDYILTDQTKSLLSTFDYTKPKRIAFNQEETISFLQSSSNNVNNAVFRYYDSNGTQIGLATQLTNNLPFSFTGTSSYSNSQNMRLDLGTGTLNQIPPDNTARYTVQLNDNTSTQLGPLVQYVIEDFCEDHVRLMWLNPLGGFDYDNFILVNDTTNLTQKTFRKELFYNYISTDRGETVFHSQSIFSLTLSSKILNQSESDWMKSLFLSPEVYMYYEDQWQAVVISTNSYNKRIARRDKIQIYTFTVRSAHNRVGNP